MITIQSGMLIALGFLVACLLGLLVAPAFWSRAVRLTTRRIKDTMPLSELEIEADRDRIRAEYAIKMHKLESLVDQVKLAGARQQIEINRRDAQVNMLESDLERLQSSYEEAQNARRVLEQTVTERRLVVEARPSEAKKAAKAREREVEAVDGARAIAQLKAEHEKQLRTLRTKNDEQSAEVARLKAAIVVFERDAEKDGKGAIRESKIALKARVQSLEAQTMQQAETVSKLRSELASANERLEQQAAQIESEARRRDIDHAAVDEKRPSPAASRPTLAERVAQVRARPTSTFEAVRSVEREGVDSAASGGAERVVAASASSRATGTSSKSEAQDPVPDAIDSHDDGRKVEAKRSAAAGASASGARPRLLDRLAGLSRTS